MINAKKIPNDVLMMVSKFDFIAERDNKKITKLIFGEIKETYIVDKMDINQVKE